MIKIEQNIPLAPLTTLGLGGSAEWFCRATSELDFIEAFRFASERRLPLAILGGGSNTLVADEGFAGLVLQVATRGREVVGDYGDRLLVRVAAGEAWDELVEWSVSEGLSGLELLSGIPGLAGAAPVQNIGAYGDELASTLLHLELLESSSESGPGSGGGRRQLMTLSAAECDLRYRSSLFKQPQLRGRYLITAIYLALRRLDVTPAETTLYPQLSKLLVERGHAEPIDTVESGRIYPLISRDAPRDWLQTLRAAVLDLRHTKSMLYSADDPESHSAGSFFLNPLVDELTWRRLLRTLEDRSIVPPQIHRSGECYKLPAAFLIEAAGFRRGYSREGVGISRHHSLALVHRGGGTTAALLALAGQIEQSVAEQFGIELEREPQILYGHKQSHKKIE